MGPMPPMGGPQMGGGGWPQGMMRPPMGGMMNQQQGYGPR